MWLVWMLSRAAGACSRIFAPPTLSVVPIDETASVPIDGVIRVFLDGEWEIGGDEVAAALRLVGPTGAEIPVKRRQWSRRIDLVPEADLARSTRYTVQRLVSYVDGERMERYGDEHRWYPISSFTTGTGAGQTPPPAPGVTVTSAIYDESTCGPATVVRLGMTVPSDGVWTVELEERTFGVLTSTTTEGATVGQPLYLEAGSPPPARGALTVRAVVRGATGASVSPWVAATPEGSPRFAGFATAPPQGEVVPGPTEDHPTGKPPLGPRGCGSLRFAGGAAWPGPAVAPTVGLLGGKPTVVRQGPQLQLLDTETGRTAVLAGTDGQDLFAGGAAMEIVGDTVAAAWFLSSGGSLFPRPPIQDAWAAAGAKLPDLPGTLTVGVFAADGSPRWTRTVLATSRRSLEVRQIAVDGDRMFVTWFDRYDAKTAGWVVVDADGTFVATGVLPSDEHWARSGGVAVVPWRGGWMVGWGGNVGSDPGVWLTAISRDGGEGATVRMHDRPAFALDLAATPTGIVAAWRGYEGLQLGRWSPEGPTRVLPVDRLTRGQGAVPRLARVGAGWVVVWSIERDAYAVVVGDDADRVTGILPLRSLGGEAHAMGRGDGLFAAGRDGWGSWTCVDEPFAYGIPLHLPAD